MVQRIGAEMNARNDETGLTVLFVEQNIDMIRSMAGRWYVTDKGVVIDRRNLTRAAD